MFEISLLDLSASCAAPARGALDVALTAARDAGAAAAAKRAVDLRVVALAPTPVAIDDDRLTLVLINLIDNAIKHGRRGGRIEVSAAHESPRTVTVFVDDDGPGIPLHARERIFALGERGPGSAGGSGIGLALVRLILERAGGRVEVRESPLGGGRFAVTLPVQPP